MDDTQADEQQQNERECYGGRNLAPDAPENVDIDAAFPVTNEFFLEFIGGDKIKPPAPEKETRRSQPAYPQP